MYELHNCNCIDFMKDMVLSKAKVDLILTDPPYEIGTNDRGAFKKGRAMGRGELDFISRGFDYQTCFDLFLKIQDKRNIIVFCSNAQISKTMKYFEDNGLNTTLLIWHKTNPVPYTNNPYLSDIEFIVWAKDNGAYWNKDLPISHKSKVFRSGITPSKGRIHPAQKRIDLLQRILGTHSKKGDIVFDPFSGSGSTGVACILEEREFVGCEIEPSFFKSAKDRLDSAMMDQRTSLFYEDPVCKGNLHTEMRCPYCNKNTLKQHWISPDDFKCEECYEADKNEIQA